jgi:lipoprotein-releasing system permease protein
LDCVLLAGFGIYNNPEHDDIWKMIVSPSQSRGFQDDANGCLFQLDNHFTGVGFGLLFGYLFQLSLIIFLWNHLLPMVKTYPIDYNIVYYVIGIFYLYDSYSWSFPALKAKQIPVEIIRGK